MAFSEGGVDPGRVFCAGLGDVGAAASAASSGLGECADDVAGVDAACDEVGGGGGDEGGAPFDFGGEDDEGGPELAAEAIGDVAKDVVADGLDACDDEVGVADALGLGDEAVGDGGGLEAGELFGLGAEPFELGLEGFDACFELGGGGIEAVGDAEEAFLLFEEVGFCGASGDGLDATGTGGDGAFADDVDEADLAGVVDVGAAAEFGAEDVAIVADFDDADFAAVFVAEEGEGTGFDGLAVAGGAPLDFEVVADFFVGELLDFDEGLAWGLFEVGEVESKPFGCDEGPLLANVGPEDGAQGGVEDVGAGVVACGAAPPVEVDGGGGALAGTELSFDDAAAVDDGTAGGLGIFDEEDAGGGEDVPAVADLAAAFGIEGGDGEDDFGFLAFGEEVDEGVAAEDGDECGVGFGVGVADEAAVVVAELLDDGGDFALEEGALLAGACALGFEGCLESEVVDGEAFGGGDFAGELDGEAEGVVEGEGLFAGDGGGAGGTEPLEEVFEAVGTGFEGAGEAFFFGGEGALDELLVFDEVGVGVAEAADGGGGETVGEWLADSDFAGEVDGAADDAAEHVPAAFVAGHDAIADEQGGGAAVFGHGTDGVGLEFGGGPAEVIDADDALCFGEDGEEDIGFENGALALEDHGDALEAAAGIDVFGGKAGAAAVGVLVELHEDEVPDFEEPIAVADAGGASVGRGVEARFGGVAVWLEVVVNLAVGAAGAAGAGGVFGEGEPVVEVFVAAVDVVVGEAYLAPVGVAVVVVEVDGGVEAGRVELVDVGEEFPCPADGFALEVVAEAEVAEHFECGEVGEVADFFDVGGAEAALDGDDAWGGGGFFAHELGLELLHSGGGEHRGGVADGNEGPGWEQQMAAFAEEGDEGVADLVGGARGVGHGRIRHPRGGWRGLSRVLGG